ncbi:glycosidase [Chitinivorax tropicus]|uniref:Glycosidase n=1 Tax=Chitinivorax tropicus TaxID=714531 RepID=A0A840MS76_9PROT|nr:alpha-amylase family glycosyl hydrolase [Chitinivorax tropicus]MBB5019266.1 glycosidase [Chitinivorax tropicus]
MFKRCLAALLCTCLMAMPAMAGQPADISPVPMRAKDSNLPAHWYQRGVFMEILVRSYQDTNGDGIGDLNGLISRLDYLQSLGIKGIWLMPIFQSADHDHGYTVVDYRAIEPAYGTLADFDRLLAEAHRRGIGVIIDYVINHSAATHPLFLDAQTGAQAQYRDWYVWQADKPVGWTAFDGDPWHAGQVGFYYGAFGGELPDFNLRNPLVVDFHLDNLRFWLNRGVDGFRFDAVGTLVENSSVAWENQPDNHPIMGRIQGLLAEYGNRFMICEAPSDPAAFAASSSCGHAFAFGLQKHLIKSIKMGRLMPDVPYLLGKLPMQSMGTLLSNHDAFAGNRLSQQFADDEASYRLAAAALMSLPGIPFIYYGEEIGLGVSTPVTHQDQELRGPMSWNGTAKAGFTKGKPFRPLVGNHRTHHVGAQLRRADSLLNTYKQLITLRNDTPALSVGAFRQLSQAHEPVFMFTRSHEQSTMLVVLNLAARPMSVKLPVDQCDAWQIKLALPALKAWQPDAQCQLVLPAQQAVFLSGP